jgi:hypothetical protein
LLLLSQSIIFSAKFRLWINELFDKSKIISRIQIREIELEKASIDCFHWLVCC